jgi:hypothetical protein
MPAAQAPRESLSVVSTHGGHSRVGGWRMQAARQAARRPIGLQPARASLQVNVRGLKGLPMARLRLRLAFWKGAAARSVASTARRFTLLPAGRAVANMGLRGSAAEGADCLLHSKEEHATQHICLHVGQSCAMHAVPLVPGVAWLVQLGTCILCSS